MRSTIVWAAVVTVGALAACSDAMEPVGPQLSMVAARDGDWRIDIRSERMELLAADAAQAEAASSGDFAAGFASYLAPDAVYLPPGSDAVEGAGAIEAHLVGTHPAGTSLVRHPLRGDVSAAGDFGITFGVTEMTQPGSSTIRYGKYVAAWSKSSSGWRLVGYLPNASPGELSPPPDWYRQLVDNGVRSAGPGDAEEELASVLSADADFSAASVADGAGDAFYRYAHRDGIVLLNGSGIAYGRDVIRSAYTLPPGYELRWVPLGGVAASTGDLAYTWGTYEFELPSGAVLHGKYMSLWEKEPTGVWRFVADAGNTNPAPGP